MVRDRPTLCTLPPLSLLPSDNVHKKSLVRIYSQILAASGNCTLGRGLCWLKTEQGQIQVCLFRKKFKSIFFFFTSVPPGMGGICKPKSSNCVYYTIANPHRRCSGWKFLISPSWSLKTNSKSLCKKFFILKNTWPGDCSFTKQVLKNKS